MDSAVRQVQSSSMFPSLVAGDEACFSRSAFAPQPGEIWVAWNGARHVIHRVLFVHRGRILLKGDWNLRPDGWFPRSALFGPVLEIQHDGHWRPANRLRDRALGLALSGVGTSYQASRLLARKLTVTVLGESRTRSLAATLRSLRAKLP
ncbi:MAG: S24/S26 family peptidase [Myxococcales bacterium]